MREKEMYCKAGDLKKELLEFSKTASEKKEVERKDSFTATCTTLSTIICC